MIDLEYQWARRAHARFLRAEGLTFREIGKRMGVTPERAGQMAYDQGSFLPWDDDDYVRARREYVKFLRARGMILSEIGKRLGLTPERVRQINFTATFFAHKEAGCTVARKYEPFQ